MYGTSKFRSWRADDAAEYLGEDPTRPRDSEFSRTPNFNMT